MDLYLTATYPSDRGTLGYRLGIGGLACSAPVTRDGAVAEGADSSISYTVLTQQASDFGTIAAMG
jgi:hypothetical protein